MGLGRDVHHRLPLVHRCLGDKASKTQSLSFRNCETFRGDRHVSRPLEGRLVSAVTEFAIEDYGSR